MRIFLTVLASLLISLPAMAKTITLTKENTLVIRTPIISRVITPLEQQLLVMDGNLLPGEPIYLYLNTPGGSIDAGLEFIEVAKSIDRPIITITKFAASMGFIIVQALNDRYIIDTGTLMAHRASGGVEGQIPGELNTRAKFALDYCSAVDKIVMNRLNMTEEELFKFQVFEHWSVGQKAVDEGLADEIVDVKCGENMKGTDSLKIPTMFGVVTIKFSACPLISSPLEVNFGDIKRENLSKEELEFLNEFISSILKNQHRDF